MNSQKHTGTTGLALCFAVAVALSYGCASPKSAGGPVDVGTRGQAQLGLWNSTGTVAAIRGFLEAAVDPGHPDYIDPAERLAVIDFDGTLIAERPQYLHLELAVLVLRDKVAANPQLGDKQPYRAAIQGDWLYVRANARLVIAEAAVGQSVSAYRKRAVEYLASGFNNELGRSYAALVYSPMRQLIAALQRRNFRVLIVSTSQQEFIRSISSKCLGVDPADVVGSMVALSTSPETGASPVRGDRFWDPYNAGEGKVLRIWERTGRLPVVAIGNSRGDEAMLRAAGARLGSLVLVVNHDDAAREYEYEDTALLDSARQEGWTIISMKDDWADVFGTPCLP